MQSLARFAADEFRVWGVQGCCTSPRLFPTLAVGLLDFEVDVVLARLEADFIVTNHQVSLQCPTAEYPCSAQPQSIPAVPNRRDSLHCPTAKYPCIAQLQSIPAVPNHRVSPQCPTAEIPYTAQPQSIPAVPNCKVSLQCPTTKYPCRAQPKNITAVPNRRVSLECPTAEYQYSCSAFAALQGRQLRRGRETLHFSCNNGFRVGMLKVVFFRGPPLEREPDCSCSSEHMFGTFEMDLASRLVRGITSIAVGVMRVINLLTK